MTEREAFEYMEKRREVYNRSGGVCEIPWCTNRIVFDTYHMSHIIGKGKVNMGIYGKEIIHHPLNIVAACGLDCNSAASIGVHSEEIKVLVEKIREAINE